MKMGNNQGNQQPNNDIKDTEQIDTKETKETKETENKEVINVMIDIDGTVSDDIPNEESYNFRYAEVLENAVESVNDLYDRGYIITFFTARREEHRLVTETWLDEHGFKYHDLLMNKPRGGNYIWIDNHNVLGIKYKDNWHEITNCFPNF